MAELQEKLDTYLLNLKDAPNCNAEDLYRWADYVELKCLANADGFFSSADFIDVVRPNSEDLGQGDHEEIENERRRKISKAEKNDKWEIRSKEIFNVIEVRSEIFSEYYPFIISENEAAITLKEDLNLNNKKYLFLLLSSNLQFTSDFKKELTGSFEYMSRDVLINFLPPHAKVMLFGSSNTEEKDDSVVNEIKFWDKLLFLEDFVKAKIQIKEEDLNVYNKGDGGLDIVAIIPTGDEETHFPVIFAQCACSPEDWITKQADIKRDKWDQWILLKTFPLYYMFIPQNYRNSQGNWFRASTIQYTTLVDRQRILKNFNNDENFMKYSSFNIVENIINTKEGAF